MGSAMRIFILMFVLLVVSSNAAARPEVMRFVCTELIPSGDTPKKAEAQRGYVEIQGDTIILKSIRGFDGSYAKSGESGAEFIFGSPGDEHLWGKLDRNTGRFTISTYIGISHSFTSELEGAKYWEGVCRPV
jgi:hypothetical protein